MKRAQRYALKVAGVEVAKHWEVREVFTCRQSLLD